MATERTEWTFAMVDLAGFTALTESHGDEHAADLAVGFANVVRAELGASDRLVKTIGDAVLLASPEPEAALKLVGGILAACLAQDLYPVARVGMNHGPAIQRDGDFFGASVNLAARVAAQAAGGQVVATQGVADAARDLGLTTQPLGDFELKNVSDRVALWDLGLHAAPADRSVDPVCRMLVDHAKAAGRLNYNGRVYWFCSLACAGRFAGSPASIRFADGATE